MGIAGMSEITWVTRDDRDTLMADLARHVAEQLQAGIEHRGVAMLAVSGGSTVKTLFPMLAEQAIEWQHVHIILVDDRWVDSASADSNERLVRELLLQSNAATATFHPMKTSDPSPEAAVTTRNAQYASLPWPCDVMMLGMGEDGHTASLHPCSDQVEHGLSTSDFIVATHPKTAPNARMSLSMSAIVNALEIIVLTCGESKKPVLEAALAPGEVKELPIRGALRATCPCRIYYAP